MLLLIPATERQLVDLATRLPSLLQQFAQWLLSLRTRFLASGTSILTESQAAWLQNLQAGDLVAMVQQRWGSIGRARGRPSSAWARGLGTAVAIVLYLVATPVVTFFLLASWERFTGSIAQLVPPARREDVFAFLREYDHLLGRYVRGTLTEAGLVGIVTGGGLAILGFPGALLVGVIWGLGNVIPYFGLVHQRHPRSPARAGLGGRGAESPQARRDRGRGAGGGGHHRSEDRRQRRGARIRSG